jgi:hypothetical protein
MSERVSVTEPEHAKAEALFLTDGRFRVQAAPDGEPTLSAAVRERSVRAVMVGVVLYFGPRCQSLGELGHLVPGRTSLPIARPRLRKRRG